MHTTLVKDSQVGDAWITKAVMDNPIRALVDPATGQPNGTILTCPVRLAFCDSLFAAKLAMRNDPNSKMVHQVTLLFPPTHVQGAVLVDMSPMWAEVMKIIASDFPNGYNPQTGQFQGIDNPICDGGVKTQLGGFTPGCAYTNVKSMYKPPVVDARNNPIVDQQQIYAGCWAIVALSCYASGKGQVRKGPRFGLLSVMKYADDQPLAGGAVDPKQVFKGVNVPPPIAASGAFAQTAQLAMNQQPYGQQAIGTYYPPVQPQFSQRHGPDDDMSQFMGG